MRVIRFAVAIAIVMMMSGTSVAEPLRMGIGLSVDDDKGTIYFPIEKGRYVVEPMIRVSWDEKDMDGVSSSVRGTSTDIFTEDESLDSRMYKAGVGFFRSVDLVEKTRMLVGMRVGYQYMKREADVMREYSSGKQSSRVFNEDLDGAFIEPLVSLEYALTGHVFLGGTVSVSYARLTGSHDEIMRDKSDSGDVSVLRVDEDITQSTSSTETVLYVKYYF
ncbi:hypothetical protein [Desulfoluna sp.]|uniref:hypothetical protein n=1 Tax=Desulfoluna sp. TaxID=2045199 RepID=UPI00261466F7|nr:hypothetical protein [Desulfoluna sp.]